jgi:hypothetical protein
MVAELAQGRGFQRLRDALSRGVDFFDREIGKYNIDVVHIDKWIERRKSMKTRVAVALLGLALFAAVAFTGCTGDDGKIYGSIWWSSSYSLYTYNLGTTGGFPSNVTKSVEYVIQPGSYYFSYSLYYGPYGSSQYYGSNEVAYTVSANKGKFLSDGSDKHFEIDCYSYGPEIVGANIVPISSSVDSKTGGIVKEYANDAITVKVQCKKVDMDSSAFVQQK